MENKNITKQSENIMQPYYYKNKQANQCKPSKTMIVIFIKQQQTTNRKQKRKKQHGQMNKTTKTHKTKNCKLFNN